jgi:predicted acetyltransferase
MRMDESEIRLRAGAAEDWDAISDLMGYVFHSTFDDETRATEGSVFEPERAIVAEDGDVVVGHAAAYTRDLTVPGGIVPAAHVTLVGVAPTHRRRGLLNRMMKRQLAEIAEAGREPVASLWASETKIYPRYGYGMAALRLQVEIMTQEIRPPELPTDGYEGKLRLVDPADAIDDFAKVYEQLRPEKTGWSSRDERWWKFVLADPSSDRGGATAFHGVVHDTPHGPTGYAVWRNFGRWEEHGPDGETRIREVVAADPQTYAALWRFLLTIDLTRTARAGYLALDEPLLHMVDEPRRLGNRIGDGLWIRVVDLPAALAARRYRCPVDLVLDVTDPLLPQNTGRWRLTGGSDTATCTRTGDPADLACTVLELGAIYLGGTSLASLAAAGRVRELTPGAVNAASTAFGWHRMPHPTETF